MPISFRPALIAALFSSVTCLGLSATVGLTQAVAAPASVAGSTRADQQFVKTKAAFLQALWQQDPDMAMAAGKYQDANKLVLPDQASRAAYVSFVDHWLAQLDKVNDEQLSAKEQTDLALIRNYLKGSHWYLTQFREFEWNPTQYNIAGSFDAILNTDFAPKAKRVRVAIQRLQNVPAYYLAAKASIKNPTPEHTRLAIKQSAGAISVLAELEKAAAAEKLDSKDKAALDEGLKNARAAVGDYVQFLEALEKTLDPATARSFRIGKELYEGKFAADIQSSFSAEQAYQRAIKAKEEAHRNMEKLADQLWDKTMGGQAKPADGVKKIAMVIDKLSENHVAAKDLYPEIRRQLPQLEKWIREHDLVSLDLKKPLVVRETPEYQRGVTVASIEAPGIFRPNDKTYYNVTPFDGQPAEQVESTLREYNHWVLQVLNIHEAIPGHYTQLQHANQSPSVIKTLFGNGAMVEGWAVYSERMMLESGYGGNTPEMWLMYYKWNLRAVCNTILDYQVHVLGMTEAEAKDFLVNQAFQTKAESDGKWLRVQYTSVQLTSYFSGYSEILELREQLKKQQGDKFKLKQFHEQFLSYGSAPVGMIKKLMLKDAVK
ncbi:DUF885 domain-containing protein [Undibacterium sp. TS12]|uniref:DUF885 domain-containing protein n=1 Tax=Undibacterium sp. TS12 TaxID=2908202 RepID=UPI001F4C7146|nr:DUF885 domain-containing protein [Undibacterium sp. TS12]MCH8622130.1 DUF885 domain-containing protein [Undibacterium sp. TS12]